MSASGVDKAKLDEPGRDILLVSGYDAGGGKIVLSVPPDVEPRRVSVDAIEHWMIYRGEPEVGAILHVHAWIDGIEATEINYPCGTAELAESVAALVAAAPGPGARGRRPAQPRDHGDRLEPRPRSSTGSSRACSRRFRWRNQAAGSPSAVRNLRRAGRIGTLGRCGAGSGSSFSAFCWLPSARRRRTRPEPRTTTTSTDTTSTTATSTTTTTGHHGHDDDAPPTTYSRLEPSYLSKSCVGAGAAAIAEPGRQVLVLGTPASNLGPSAYPTAAPIVRFLSSTATGSGCTTAHVALGSVALFGGVVTASSIQATHGTGTVSGFEIYGSPVTLRAGHAVRIGGWGEVTLGKTVGRLTAPLVVQLLAAHHGLPAGTTIAFAFAASPQVVHRSKAGHHSAATTNHGSKTKQANDGPRAEEDEPPPDFPAAPDPFVSPGVLAPAARHNAVVSTAMRYLGIRYQWGGASPKTGFDCSGLVKYVFAQFGVPMVHFAAAQWHSPDGVWVPPNRLQPGDLVFFVGSDGTRKAPGHVGIYVDDGYFIDAPHTGSFVRIDRLDEPRLAAGYVGARRIDSQLLGARHLLGVTNGGCSPTLPAPAELRSVRRRAAADRDRTPDRGAHPGWGEQRALARGRPAGRSARARGGRRSLHLPAATPDGERSTDPAS